MNFLEIIAPLLSILASWIAIWQITKKKVSKKVNPENKNKLLAELRQWKNPSIRSSYIDTTINSLNRIEKSIGKPFSLKSFGFTNSLAMAYPLLSIYLLWTITGENISRIEGFAESFVLFDNRYILWEYFNAYTIIRYVILLGVVGGFLKFQRNVKSAKRKLPALDINTKFKDYDFRTLLRHYLHYIFTGFWPFSIVSIVFIFFNEFAIISIVLYVLLTLFNSNEQLDEYAGGYANVGINTFILVFVVFLAAKEFIDIKHWLIEYALLNSLFFLFLFVQAFLYYTIFDRFIRLGIVRAHALALFYLTISCIILFNLNKPDTEVINTIMILCVFFMILPAINSIFDFLSINYTRFIVKKSLKDMNTVNILLFFLSDLAIALVCLSALFACFWLGLWAINIISGSILEGYSPINIKDIVNTMVYNKWDVSLWWIYFTLFTTLLPTAIHLIIAVGNLLVNFPRKVLLKKRINLCDKCIDLLNSDTANFADTDLKKMMLKMMRIKVISYFITTLVVLFVFMAAGIIFLGILMSFVISLEIPLKF